MGPVRSIQISDGTFTKSPFHSNNEIASKPVTKTTIELFDEF